MRTGQEKMEAEINYIRSEFEETINRRVDVQVMRTSDDKRTQNLREELNMRIQGTRIDKRQSPAEWTGRSRSLRRSCRNTSAGAGRIKPLRFDDFITWTLFLSPVRDRGAALQLDGQGESQGRLYRQIQPRKDSLIQRWKTVHRSDMLRVCVISLTHMLTEHCPVLFNVYHARQYGVCPRWSIC